MTKRATIVVLYSYLIAAAFGFWLMRDKPHTSWHGYQTPHPALTKNPKGQYDC